MLPLGSGWIMSGVEFDERAQYRALIDALVLACREGQGRIGRGAECGIRGLRRDRNGCPVSTT
jgi:hypothetical protein